jgi:hypothetical protein
VNEKNRDISFKDDPFNPVELFPATEKELKEEKFSDDFVGINVFGSKQNDPNRFSNFSLSTSSSECLYGNASRERDFQSLRYASSRNGTQIPMSEINETHLHKIQMSFNRSCFVLNCFGSLHKNNGKWNKWTCL